MRRIVLGRPLGLRQFALHVVTKMGLLPIEWVVRGRENPGCRESANSFWLVDPHPSTMLNAMDSAARIIWDLSDV